MADHGVPTTSELKKFKVVELKAKLQEFGLPVNGLKAELIERLQEFYAQQNKQQHVHETSLSYSGTQQVSPMQSPEIRQVLPAQSPMIHKVLPAQSQEVHQVLPVQSPGMHQVLPVQSPVALQVSPKKSPGEQHVSLLQSPGAHQASPEQFTGAKPVSPTAPQVTPMQAPSLQRIIIPENNPVAIQSPNLQPKSPLKSPGVTRQVSPQKSPVLQSKVVLVPSVSSQPVQLPEKVHDEQPVRVPTQQNISVQGGQSKVEVTKGALPEVNIPQPNAHSDKAAKLLPGNQMIVSLEGQAKMEVGYNKAELPQEQTKEPVAELQSSTAVDEEKMSTNQDESSKTEKEVTALDKSTSQKTPLQEEVQPAVQKKERENTISAEKQVVFPKKQMGESNNEVPQMREKAASIQPEQRQMPPHRPERPAVSPPVRISQSVPRSQFSHQKQVDVEMRGQSAVSLSSRPPQLAPVRDQSTEDSGIEMSEPPSEEMSYGGDQKVVAAEKTEMKGKKKKKKKKKRRQRQQAVQEDEFMYEEDDVEVEYIPEQFDASDPNYRAFAKIFEAFKLSDEPVKEKEKVAEKKEELVEAKKTEVVVMKDSDDEDDEEDKPKEDDKPKISKKKLRKMNRLSVAELKQLVPRPDVVEMHDVTAQDPKLLVFLKSCRNTVPVPRHWCFKRKYLQGKRGIIKAPFELPEFIKKTGIMEMREAMQEKEEQKTLKAKMREKVRPKMGKINIDYQKLHDAFFKWQTKPKMTIHGDLYYEGKEFETKLKEKKPGDLSEELRTALGMPIGSGSNLVPPPWLIAMQRYGPPPSYPNLKIPGLNAAIPEGAAFGYHAGGWGKPPVDETGRPLYGDVFGTQQTEVTVVEEDDQVDKAPWGELESEEESEESSEEESEEEEDQTGLVTPADTGLVTPSGLTSIPAGMETPDMIELRKRKTIEDAMETGAEQPSLYTVLPEKRATVGGAMMGSAHVYDINATVQPGVRKVGAGAAEGIEVALDPSELELDPLAMQARYEEQMKERESQLQKEDLSDMVAEHAAKQQKKRKKATDSGKAAKKYKEFKF